MKNDIRWRQRFSNLEKAFQVFQRRVDAYSLEPEEEGCQMALVQAFEIIIELSWKTLKDYLENQGYDNVKNSKQAIRQAFQDSIICEAEIWMSAIEIRNETSHTYAPAIMQKVLQFVTHSFYPIARDLYHTLKESL